MIKCLQRRLAWCNHTKLPYDSSVEQYYILPRALADEDGHPHKANKRNWTDKLYSRYHTSEPCVFFKSPPWVPQVANVDAMYMVNIRPLRKTKTITEYAQLLFDRFALEHFKAGVKEVHLIFDKPGRQAFNPKQFEHAKRYSPKGKSCNQHEHISFTPQTSIPQSWREYLECRECKQSIVEAIGLSFLQKGRLLLTGCHQSLLIAGCFSGKGENNGWIISSSKAYAEPVPQYQSNAEEADNRIWRHAIQSLATNILIYSPDTDVYNIGLGLIS